MSKSKSWFNNYCVEKQRGSGVYSSRLFHQFSLMAKNRFKWENLPNNITSLHIEKYLFENGEVGFFLDDKLGLMALPITPTGVLNPYGDSLEFMATGIDYNEILKVSDIVRIRSNDESIPSILQVSYYTDLINKIEQTMWVNLNQQKFPYIVATTKENQLTMKNIMKQVDDLEPALYIDEKLTHGGNIGINVLKTDAPYLLDDLQRYKNDVMNELLSYLGLNNTQKDKRERMLKDEINVNNSHILMNLDLEYKNRQLAATQINEKFNLNIKVVKTIEELEVKFNGEIHNGIEGINQ